MYKRNYLYEDWAGNVACVSERYYEPKSEAELIRILVEINENEAKNGNNKKRKVRIVGAQTSPSKMPWTGDYLISVKNMNQIVKFSPKKGTITVEAGISLRELNQFLSENEMSMEALPTLDFCTLAGAIATGTHGNGLHCNSSLSAQVSKIKLVRFDGSTVYLKRGRDEDFCHVVTGFGLFGAITEIKLNLVEKFDVRQKKLRVKFSSFIKNFEAFNRDYYYCRAMVYPHTNSCIVYLGEKIKSDEEEKNIVVGKNEPTNLGVFSWYISWWVYKFLVYLSVLVSIFIKLPNIFYYYIADKFCDDEILIGSLYNTTKINFEMKQDVCEYAVSYEKAGKFLTAVKRLFENNEHVCSGAPFEIRFVRQDSATMGLSKEGDCMTVNLINFRLNGNNAQIREPFWSEFERLVYCYGGKPHLAKYTGYSAKQINAVYGENLQKFNEARINYDPTDRFLTEYFDFLTI